VSKFGRTFIHTADRLAVCRRRRRGLEVASTSRRSASSSSSLGLYGAVDLARRRSRRRRWWGAPELSALVVARTPRERAGVSEPAIDRAALSHSRARGAVQRSLDEPAAAICTRRGHARRRCHQQVKRPRRYAGALAVDEIGRPRFRRAPRASPVTARSRLACSYRSRGRRKVLAWISARPRPVAATAK